MLHIFSGITALSCVHQVICLQQDLIINPVNSRIGMVMSHQPGDPLYILFRHWKILEKFTDQWRTLQLLLLSIGIAVFLPA